MCQQIFTCIAGFSRLLLFLGSLLLGIVALCLAAEINWVRSFYSTLDALDWQNNFTWLFICAVYLIVLTVAGSLGAFYDNKSIISFFALLLGINILVCVLVMAYLPNKQDSDAKFVKKLKDELNQYSFNKNNIKNETANKFWDTLQEENHCCGLAGPLDWKILSPTNSSFAKSCCKNPTTDQSGNMYCLEADPDHQMGCLQAIYAPMLLVLSTFVGAMVLSIPLALVACISSFRT